jgi:hypothetical protein
MSWSQEYVKGLERASKTNLKYLCSEQEYVDSRKCGLPQPWWCVLYICRYEKAVIAMAKQSVTLEVLSYHASASLEDAQRLRVSYVQVINKA